MLESMQCTAMHRNASQRKEKSERVRFGVLVVFAR